MGRAQAIPPDFSDRKGVAERQQGRLVIPQGKAFQADGPRIAHLLQCKRKPAEVDLTLAGPETGSTRLTRKDAFIGVWAEAKVGPVPDVVHLPRYAQTDSYSGLLAYLRGCNKDATPDVVICENDVLALGAVYAIRHQIGLRAPQDIAVNGFDDTPIAASPAYDLTTYRQPITQMAHALVKVLGGGSREDLVLPGKFI